MTPSTLDVALQGYKQQAEAQCQVRMTTHLYSSEARLGHLFRKDVE